MEPTCLRPGWEEGACLPMRMHACVHPGYHIRSMQGPEPSSIFEDLSAFLLRGWDHMRVSLWQGCVAWGGGKRASMLQYVQQACVCFGACARARCLVATYLPRGTSYTTGTHNEMFQPCARGPQHPVGSPARKQSVVGCSVLRTVVPLCTLPHPYRGT